jgi:hypothetical protein
MNTLAQMFVKINFKDVKIPCGQSVAIFIAVVKGNAVKWGSNPGAQPF